MAGMSAEDFVEEHLVDKTSDEVRYIYDVVVVPILKRLKIIDLGMLGVFIILYTSHIISFLFIFFLLDFG